MSPQMKCAYCSIIQQCIKSNKNGKRYNCLLWVFFLAIWVYVSISSEIKVNCWVWRQSLSSVQWTYILSLWRQVQRKRKRMTLKLLMSKNMLTIQRKTFIVFLQKKRWWGSISEDLKSVKNLIITITPKSILTWSGNTCSGPVYGSNRCV